ncbi:hypothetical protein OTERR_12680 [Oryzomicrobium terrae]|uniref:DprA winged helix domain-containing protein n=1 Tax=Oryzomicrobium terrae TaxID=1735038 RepID=A0A5C1E804_9RHOO|nr:hypothetical protein [Oryzomicrobium terrae]QEL64744.1 hypothetical protein OTERR_12680 [Oryzomicrobium terrae]
MLTLAALFTFTPPPVPEGLGRVHRVMGEGAPRPKTTRTVTNEEIVKVVATLGHPVSSMEIADELEVEVMALKNRLPGLVTAGKLYRTGRKDNVRYGAVL